jgi:hypothetical protein
MLSFLGVKGYRLFSEWPFIVDPYPFDRDALLLPEGVMESFDTPVDLLLKPAFDAMWQAAGDEGCHRFKSGRWSDKTDGTAII